MENKLISVIIPTYNREKSIRKSIDSVLNQTYTNLECIIVDDCSSDNTRETISKINDPRLVYLKLEKNHGPSFARNIGIEASKGEYIAFEDSDDIWAVDKLEKQIKRIENDKEIGLVYCSYSFVKNGKKIKVPSSKFDITKLEGNIFDSLLEGNKIGTPTILVRKACIDLCGGFTENLFSLEDWEFVLRIAEKFKIAYVDECLVYAKYSFGGVNEQWEQQAEAIIYILNKYYDKNLPKEKMIIALFDKLACIFNIENKKRWKEKIVPQLISSTNDYTLMLNEAIVKHKFQMINQMIYLLSDLEKLRSFIYSYIDVSKEKIVIYGAGYVGIVLARMLKILNITFEYIVDQNEIKTDEFLILNPQVLDGSIDTIILTIFDRIETERIISNIPKYIKIVNMYDLITYR